MEFTQRIYEGNCNEASPLYMILSSGRHKGAPDGRS